MKTLTLSHTISSGYGPRRRKKESEIRGLNYEDILAKLANYDYLLSQFRWSTPLGSPAVPMRLEGVVSYGRSSLSSSDNTIWSARGVPRNLRRTLLSGVVH